MGLAFVCCGDYWVSHFQDVVVIPVVPCCHLLLIREKDQIEKSLTENLERGFLQS